jgi:hypothetical protein
MRERFEEWLLGIDWSDYAFSESPSTLATVRDTGWQYHDPVTAALELSWRAGRRDALRQFWPKKPTQQQLDLAGAKIVGDEPVMVMPGETLPQTIITQCSWWWPEGTLVNEQNHSEAPIFVWRVEKIVKECETCRLYGSRDANERTSCGNCRRRGNWVQK